MNRRRQTADWIDMEHGFTRPVGLTGREVRLLEQYFVR